MNHQLDRCDCIGHARGLMQGLGRPVSRVRREKSGEKSGRVGARDSRGIPMKAIRILSLFLLVAGVAGLARPLHAESNDRPNKPASGLCTQVGIDVVTQAFKYEDGVVQASGSWTASGGPAKGVLLEYRLDSDRYQAETQLGTAGKWTYSESYKD